MQHITTRSALLLLLFLASQLSAQNTRELFSRPDLSLGAFHFNFYDGTWNTSYRYAGDTTLCGDTLLVFEAVRYTLDKRFLKIQAGKVFLQNPSNPCGAGTLYYDFDLQPGQSFQLQSGGPLMSVTQVGTRTLLNGETRRYLKLSNGSWTVEWVEGLGDVGNGLLPAFYDFEGYDRFVCARDASGDLWQNPAEVWKCDSLLCPTPITQFSATTDEKTAFFANNSLNSSAWLWEFGDGQTSSEQNPEHTYSGPGCYEVCLTSYTDCLQNGQRLCLPTPVCVAPFWQLHDPAPNLNSQYISDIEFLTPEIGWVLGSTSIWKTTDGGQSWVSQPYPIVPPPKTRILRKIQMLDAQKGIIACGHYGGDGSEKAILVTQDGGNSWEERAPGSYFLTEAILTGDGQGFATGQFRELIYSADGGETWATREIPGTVELLWMQYMGGDTLYAMGYQGLPPQHTPAFITTFDAGLNWQIKLMPDYPPQYDAHFFNTQEGWALGKEGQLIHTVDAGQSWQPYFFGEMLKAQSIAFATPQHGWVVGDKGLVLHTTHAGFDWKRENCGYTGNLRSLAVADTQTAFVNGFSTEILKYVPGLLPNCGITSSSSPAKNQAIPLHLFPNPATDLLRIESSERLEVGDQVLVFNMLGQLAATHFCDGETIAINIGQLPTGCYVLAVQRGNAPIARGRFIKQ